MTKKMLICDCLGSQAIDGAAIEAATGVACSKLHTSLCVDQIEAASKAMEGGDVMIACQQERSRFEHLAEELGVDAPGFVDLRDRAGWSDQASGAGPKMAALVAEALVPVPAIKTLDIVSAGTCLIIGDGDVALKAAADLCETLAVTVLMADECELPVDRRFDVVRGYLVSAAGAFGGFTLRLDELQQVVPGGRGALGLSEALDGAVSQCDVILDVSGRAPLFAAAQKRDGYLRADPGSLPAVAKAVMQAAQMVGTFEKPLYVLTQPALCAHSRAEKVACTKCLDICPTGAIVPDGEHVSIDPMICAGCGACTALCPSGAITYDAPSGDSVFRRLNVLAATYRKAGGVNPRLLVHDEDHGQPLISMAARFGRGLPSDVIPFEVSALAGFGHAEMLVALACGFADVAVLLAPMTEREAPEREAELAAAVSPRVRLLDITDPDALSDVLYDMYVPDADVSPVLPMGTRRQVTRLAAKALQPEADVLALPEGAPYGAVVLDAEACTLCLSCVSLCPSGALGDNADMPQLRFQEDACLQCGLCAGICPENAITLEPRLNLTDEAFTQTVLHEEEPFACVECGSLFGVKSTVERITEKLAGKHAMFAKPEAARMIQMCDNCRINANYHSENNPFQGADRPQVRTTDDYLSKRKDH